jgi:hypothetical protein
VIKRRNLGLARNSAIDVIFDAASKSGKVVVHPFPLFSAQQLT